MSASEAKGPVRGPRPIEDVAAGLGIAPEHLVPYGEGKAKVRLQALDGDRPRGRLVLVTAITPTPAGEGKTTTSIGLAQGLALLGKRVCVALREPSLGPTFGRKGGATGGGRASLVPAEDVNLHFTGDFHAVSSAHNLLAALLDNHLHFGNGLGIDPRKVLWPRVIDLNDRALRHAVIGLGGPIHGVPRETGFDITPASEVMAALCLAADAEDLRRRLSRLLVALTLGGEPVTAADLGAVGSMLALLKDALRPNLVQTTEGVPALVHGGPFANIAHGCNSVLATRTGLAYADWTITEAGFATELGAEKFFHIKCRTAGIDAACAVVVATVRALKHHGGTAPGDLEKPDPAAVEAGLPNLWKHVDNVHRLGKPAIVAVNRFAADTDDEVTAVVRACAARDVPAAVSDHFARGGEGAVELAERVVDHAIHPARRFTPVYRNEQPVKEKLVHIAREMYGASGVAYTREAEKDLAFVERLGMGATPLCVAKTPASLSDDPTRPGLPHGFEVTCRRFIPAPGAGFVIALLGDVLRMPGLPKEPQAAHIDLIDGVVVNLR
jgi:formate--tetrahydrofolate ligase